jgi:putative glutamine amidotransferase
MQPFIAVTVRELIDNSEEWTPIVYGQFHTYTDAVVRAGGVPIIVPLIDHRPVLRRLYDQCDGLLLSGGNDLDPSTYKSALSSRARNRARSVSPRRDKQELQLLKWALEDDKPVFGICRGMQLINVALGGSLHQDIGADLPAAHNHEASADHKNFSHLAHKLKINPGSQLAAILETDAVATNALHHQAIKKLGAGLVVTAHSEDGVIEAIELPTMRFVIGVQSHPEALEAETEQLWRKLFIAFVNSAAVKR